MQHAETWETYIVFQLRATSLPTCLVDQPIGLRTFADQLLQLDLSAPYTEGTISGNTGRTLDHY